MAAPQPVRFYVTGVSSVSVQVRGASPACLPEHVYPTGHASESTSFISHCRATVNYDKRIAPAFIGHFLRFLHFTLHRAMA